MSIEQMRAAISTVYPSKTWRERVQNMSDRQVFAVYQQFLNKNKL